MPRPHPAAALRPVGLVPVLLVLVVAPAAQVQAEGDVAAVLGLEEREAVAAVAGVEVALASATVPRSRGDVRGRRSPARRGESPAACPRRPGRAAAAGGRALAVERRAARQPQVEPRRRADAVVAADVDRRPPATCRRTAAPGPGARRRPRCAAGAGERAAQGLLHLAAHVPAVGRVAASSLRLSSSTMTATLLSRPSPARGCGRHGSSLSKSDQRAARRHAAVPLLAVLHRGGKRRRARGQRGVRRPSPALVVVAEVLVQKEGGEAVLQVRQVPRLDGIHH